MFKMKTRQAHAWQRVGLRLESLEDRTLLSVYSVTDLGTLGGTYSYATAINAEGQIVGFSYTPGNTASRAFFWDDGVMTDLGTLGGTHSFAYGINDLGQIVGYSYLADGTHHAVMWDDGQIIDLGTLGGSYSQANAINNLGQVVGYANMPLDEPPHAFMWQNGAMTDLGKLTGDISSAYGINDKGQAAGYGDVIPGQFSPHAILWENGELRDLGTLPGGAGSTALNINQYGQVIGKAKIGAVDDSHYAFLWTNGEMKSLGGLPGARGSAGQGVNRFAQIVGTSPIMFTANAYVYFTGQMFNLNDVLPKAQSGWFFSVATSVNNAGQIVGSGYGPNGQHAYVITPVNPGPVTMLQITGEFTSVEAGTTYAFDVTAKDKYGNTVPNYTGTVSFASSDVKAALPATYTFTPTDKGSHTFTVTYKTSRQQWVSVTDSQLGMAPTVRATTVMPSKAVALSITGPTKIVAGVPVTYKVMAVDAFGNVARDYTGSVSFSSTDPAATLPETYAFKSNELGVHKFTVVFNTPGTHSLFVSDTLSEGLAGGLENITVQPSRSVNSARWSTAVFVTAPPDVRLIRRN